MATFNYEATNRAGQQISSTVEAPTIGNAALRIRQQGCFATKLTPAPEKHIHTPARRRPQGEQRTFSVPFNGVSLKMLTNFTRQLSTLQDAGLPIVRSLKILCAQQKKGLLKDVLAAVSAGVEDGATLSEAMARHPRAFNRLYINMVQAGETGGVLDVILQRLAEFMEKAQRLKRRVIGAMIYPTVVITMSALIVTGIMMFVVPRFQDIFRDFRTSLPPITMYLMTLSNFIANRYGWTIVLGAPFGATVFIKMLGRNPTGRRWIDSLKLRIPILGKIILKTTTARFTRTLGTLLAAGVPILDALNITRDTAGNAIFEAALNRVHNAIREGESFASQLRTTNICNPVVTNMIEVGEETGDLDKMLLKIADNYDEEVDVLVGSLVNTLEPVMVLTLGGIVGTIVVALFMPLVTILQKVSETGGG